MDKTRVQWTKLWYYSEKYGTIPRTMELRFTWKKSMIDYQKLRNIDLY